MKTTKNLWSVVLCVCLAATMLCAMPAAAAENTVAHQHDFDADLGNWKAVDPKQSATIVDASAVEIVADSEAAQKGAGYLALTTGMSQTGVDAQNEPIYTNFPAQAVISGVSVVPNQLYTLSFYYKSPKANFLQATIYEYPGGEDPKATNGFIITHPLAENWTKSTIAFTTGATAESLMLQLTARGYYHAANTDNTVCIDTVTLTAEADGAMEIAAGETGYVAFPQGQYSFADEANTTPVVVEGRLTAEESTVLLGLQLDGSLAASAMLSKVTNGTEQAFSLVGEYPKIGNLKAPALKITAGEAAVTVKNVTVAKDENLIPNGNFETTDTTWGNSNSTGFSYETDTPYNGRQYLKVTPDRTKERTAYSTLGEVVKPYGTQRYLFSVYYKSNVDDLALIRIINEHKDVRVDPNDTSKKGADKEYIPSVTLKASSKWKKVEFTFERREMTNDDAKDRFYVYLGSKGTTEAEAYVAFDAVKLVPLTAENGKLAFYDTALGNMETYTAVEGDLNQVETKPEYGNFIGAPVSAIDTSMTSLSAVYVDSTLSSASKTSANAVILAVYRAVGNTKQLINVAVSPTPAMNAAAVVYPTATLDTSELTTGDEICAFLWDGISGLKPLDKAISIVK